MTLTPTFLPESATGPGESTGTTSVLPRVNLLPDSEIRSLRIAATLRRGIAGALVIMAAIATLWWLESGSIATAEDGIAALQSENAVIQQRINTLAPVGALSAQLTRQQEIVDTSVASAPKSVEVLERLRTAAEEAGGIEFATINTSYHGLPLPGEDLNRCPNPDPFSEQITIGCVSFTAEGPDRNSVAALVAALEADGFFTGPYVNATTLTSDVEVNGARVVFSGTAGITIDALVTPPTQEYLDALTAEPETTEVTP